MASVAAAPRAVGPRAEGRDGRDRRDGRDASRPAGRPRLARLPARWAAWRAGLSPRAVDAALGVVVATVVAASIPTLHDDGHATAVTYLFAPTLGAVLLGRRRWPRGTAIATFGVLVAYYSLGFPPIGLAVPLAAALYSVALAGHARFGVVLAVGASAVATTARLVEGGEDPGFVLGPELVSSLLLMLALLALGDAVRSRQGWHAEIERRAALAAAQHQREASRRVEAERLRLARELHDVLAHTVAVIGIQADVAAEALDGDRVGDAEAAGAAVSVIRGASRDALAELRATLALLRSPADADAPEVAARPDAAAPPAPVGGLAQLDRVVRAAEDSGLTVDVEVTGSRRPLPVVVDAAAHRIVQEAITNVLRHAGATRARVALSYTAAGLTVRVTDDGVGPGPTPDDGTDGYGLRGMAERAALLGGRLSAGPGPGGGFAVEAWLPVGAGA
jgi:signal transduction histidine kinase